MRIAYADPPYPGQAAKADPRSGLWREVVRILAELRPRWFVGENVPGLLSVRGGADFRQVIQDLDGLGYGVAWRVLDAQHFGVPQRRRRVLIAGCLGDPASAARVLLEPEGGAGNPAESGEAGEGTAGAAVVSTLQGGGRRGYRVDAEAAAGGHLIAHTLTSGVSASPGVNPPGRRNEDDFNLVCVTGSITHTLRAAEGADASEDGTGRGTPIIAFTNTAGATNLGIDPTYRTAPPLTLSHGNPGSIAYSLTTRQERNDLEQTQVCSTGVRRLTPLECERLQGFPDGWTDGQKDAARYRQLGNAVAVPVLEWLMRRIDALPR